MSEKNDLTVQDNSTKEVVGFVNTSNKAISTFQRQCNETLFNLFNDESLVRKFISSVQICVSKNPKLNDCTPESFRNVLLMCATVKLFPINDQCYLVPFKNKGELEATFILGYQGMITLAERAGVKVIDAQVVYENDTFSCTLGTNPSITHEADVFNADRGVAKGVYALAVLKSGHVRIFPMSMADVHKHRAKSKSWQGKGRDYSPWNEKNDPQLTMPKKTAIRQLFKFIPKDDATSKALEADAHGEYIRHERTVNADPQIEHSSTMSDKDIAAYRERLLNDEGYTETELKSARFDAIGRDQFGKLTMDEAKMIEDKLIQNRDEQTIDQTSTDKGDLFDKGQ